MGGIFDDDIFDEESDENEISADDGPLEQISQISQAVESGVRAVAHAREHKRKSEHGPRRLRVRPMPPSMQAKYPNTVSCILTQSDGRQIVLVRK